MLAPVVKGHAKGYPRIGGQVLAPYRDQLGLDPLVLQGAEDAP
ncbi:hypothetical protein [Cyanobium gracile]|uniref:Uncharacterized protein n=1 Tax=Cyanobium gracile UHCC 0281 TaxID=3110309 RepID=A0ABU5SS19_9CYAN|nr:hypothetical protein [Cyanobium gracile]MEA5441270.1 hypothetical protein [Cyanobium gracile UHCC 0281]